MTSPQPIAKRLLAPLAAAIALLGLSALPAAASAEPPSDCRDALCASTLQIGAVEARWRTPEVFYPHNEDVYAAVHVGARALPEVRSYGPALCRHRFGTAGMTVVVKACGGQTGLRVRAMRSKPGTRILRISYAAHPLLAGDIKPATSGTVFGRLTQITGLLVG